MSGFLYIIAPVGQEMPVKIGIAKDPQARLRQLQTGNPRRLRIVETFAAQTTEQARAWEELAHKLFEDRRLAGEWFDIIADEVIKRVSDWKRDNEPKPIRPKSPGAATGFSPFNPEVPAELHRTPLRDMTEDQRLEFWRCFGLPRPPSGFDDWFVVGTPKHGVLGAFPVVGFLHGEEEYG